MTTWIANSSGRADREPDDRGAARVGSASHDREADHDHPDHGGHPAMQDVGRRSAPSRAGTSEPFISGQSGKTSAESVAVTWDPNSSRANVASVVNAASSVNRWLRAPAGQVRRETGTDRDVDEQGDEQHRGGQMRRDRLAAVPEADGLAPEPRLEPDQHDRSDRRPQERAAIAMVDPGEDRQAEDLEADDRRDGPMDPLDPRLRRRRAAGAAGRGRAANPGSPGRSRWRGRSPRS